MDSRLKKHASYQPTREEIEGMKQIPEKETSFIILWTAFDKYEYIQDYHSSPHEYAWNSDKYKISPYIIIEVDKPLQRFRLTPEDKLLEKIFS